MPGIVGFWRGSGVDLQTLAQKLVHTDLQCVLEQVTKGDFAAARVGLASAKASPSSASSEVVALVNGEILSAGERNPAPLQSGEFLRGAYLADPSCGFLSRANGAFSGVLFDQGRQRIVLLTDPLGLGHLYYALDGERRLWFASEQKCFASIPGVRWDVQGSAVEEFLREGQLCGDTTWFAGVQLLRPGHCAFFDVRSGELTTEQYWDLGRHSAGRYASYQEAKEEIAAAYLRAFERASFDGKAWALPLKGDFSSRMLLASSEGAGHQIRAYTAAEEESEDLTYARKACAVRNTVHRSNRVHGENWFLQRAQLNWLADGAQLLRFSMAAVADALSGQVALSGFLGNLTLGTNALNGYDDMRKTVLLHKSRRMFGSVIRTWDNFSRQRFPFADPEFVSRALRADVPYLLDERLHSDIARTLFPEYFERIPVTGTGGRTALQVLANVPGRKKPSLSSGYQDYHNHLRSDPNIEALIWELIAGRDAIYSQFTEPKHAYTAFWSFFKGGDPSGREALMRYVSLELWLRQVLRGEFLAKQSHPRTEQSSGVPPEVSVIVPAYNVEAYVGECINSLINQELANIEILVIDDGSTDGTAAIVERYAALDSRVKLLKTPNTGVYHARNRGLELARGRFVSFVDSDDYVHSSMLRVLVAAANQHCAEVTFCDVYQFDASGELRVRGNTLQFKPGVPLSIATAPEMISDGFTTLWNRVYDRGFLVRHGLKFDESFRISADMLFLQEVLSYASTIVRIPKPMYYYRFATPKSLTSYEVRNAQYRKHLQITIELIDFWVRQGVFERYSPYILTKAIRNFLWNTHIDEEKLEEVFDELHRYVRKLVVSPVALSKIGPFERRAFWLVKAGNFWSFMRFVRTYRARMVHSKGGELSRLEQVAYQLDSFRSAVSRTLSVKVEKDAVKRRYKVAWPLAKLGLTLDYGVDNQAKKSEPPDATAEPHVNKTLTSLQAVRQRLLVNGDLESALRFAKRGASRRVLHFSNGFSVPSETFTYDVVSGLESYASLDNYMMCFTRVLARERPFSKTIQLYGASRNDLEVFSPNATAKLDLVLDKLRPDLLHCHFGWVGIPLVLWMLRVGRRMPLVITMHGTDVNMWPARHAWYRDAFKSIGEQQWVSFTTHTDTYREKLEALGVPSEHIEVIPNSFDPKFASDRPRYAFELGGHLRVISVARMDIWKGHEHLVRGFASFVRERYSNASLTLVGYGPQERALRGLVDQLGIQDHVRFYGRAAHHEIPVLLRHHDVYVQPSIRHPETLQEEGQPIAVLEAIATGIPVVVTDTGAMAETVRVGSYEGSAWVIPDKDGEAISNALEAVIRTPVDIASRRAYVSAIAEKHSQEQQLRRTVDVYRRAWADTSYWRGAGQ